MDSFAYLMEIYRKVDRATRKLEKSLAGKLHCRVGCSSCCVDDITVFEVEAEYIKSIYSEMLAAWQPHSEGGCAFLDKRGACRIYLHRPYVCRTQGYPLRWIEAEDETSITEMRDICPVNSPGISIEQLPPEKCWTIGPIEGELALLQMKMSSGDLKRVPLRDLFYT